MSLPAVSKHLKVLERAKLITRGREAQWRPCKLKPAPLKDAADWIDHYRGAFGSKVSTGSTIICGKFKRRKKSVGEKT